MRHVIYRCFLGGGERNLLQLGPYHVEIVCYVSHGARGAKRVGSCFPDPSSAFPTPDSAAVRLQAHARARRVRAVPRKDLPALSAKLAEAARLRNCATKLQASSPTRGGAIGLGAGRGGV